MAEVFLQFAIVLGCILAGARFGGISAGLFGGLGLSVLTFVFGLRPSSPPINIALIICAIASLSSTLHAAGGLDYLVKIAEKILRKNPNRITIIAPMVTCIFSLLCGSSYVALAVFPVIVEVAYEAKVRPERPVSMALLGATQALTGSPMSAATAAILGVLAVQGITLGQILAVSIPSVVLALLLGGLAMYKYGVELEDDPEFIRRVQNGEIAPPHAIKDIEILPRARLAVGIFLVAIAMIVLLGSIPQLLPAWQVGGKIVPLSIPYTITFIMFTAAAVILVVCSVKPGKILQSSIFSSGMMGVISLLGIAWMTDTFFAHNRELFIAFFKTQFAGSVWMFAIGFFIIAVLVASQGAATTIAIPLGVTLGMQAPQLIALFPLANAGWFLPVSGNLFAAIAMDRTGTTHLGKHLLNHSFMLPGIITAFGSTAISFILIQILF